MRCCVKFCETNDKVVSESAGITFHEFPSEVHLRAAWLTALGKQNTLLSDSTVVCSQHFLHDDFYVTESGSRQIRTGAIPSNVQVCRICLDTQSKLFLMSKYKLEEAYKHLLGQPLCDQRNLKQTLCIQCAQRLMNFSRFRDQSLRAHSLMMGLVEKHKMITIQHIKSINRVKYQLTSDIVTTLMKPDHDVHNSDEATSTKLDATVEVVAIKQERDSVMSVDKNYSQHQRVEMNEETNIADIFKEHSYALKPEYLSDKCIKTEKQLPDEALKMKPSVTEQVAETQDQIKNESMFQCRLCFEELESEEDYGEHMSMHLRQWHESSLETDSENHAEHFLDLDKKDKQGELYPTEQADKVETIASFSVGHPKHNENKVHQTEKIDKLNILAFENNSSIKSFTCMSCDYKSTYRDHLDRHVKTHTGETLTCELCKYTCKRYRTLVKHMRTHTGDKAHACALCNYETKSISSFKNHMRTHTGEKPFVCSVCNHKFTEKSNLVNHMKTHTGFKPFTCNFCDLKFSVKCNLVNHMRIHTGEKPFACEFCEYKSREKSGLVRHMSTHTGIKPYCCKVCNHKCATKNRLMMHMRTHTGDKPFACELCKHKFVQKSDLVKHMTTHTRLKSDMQSKRKSR